MGLFVKLDVVRLDTDLIGVPMALRGCVLTAEVLGKRTENDGWFHSALLTREGADGDLVAACCEAGLMEVDGVNLRAVGYLDRNPSQAAIGAKRASKSEAGRRGNHTKWKHPGTFEDCPQCQVIAGSDRAGSQDDRTPSPETESDPESASRRKDPTARPRLAEFVPPPAEPIAPPPANIRDHLHPAPREASA